MMVFPSTITMDFRTALRFHFLIFLTIWTFGVENQLDGNETCEDSEESCPCGQLNSYVTVPVKMCYSRIKSICVPCQEDDPCERYADCETCISGVDDCFSCPAGAYGPLCKEGLTKEEEIYPIMFTNHDGEHGHLNRRIRRQAKDDASCLVPQNLNHTDYVCWKWPNRMKCDVHCHFGYAFPLSQTRKRIHCIYDEDQWKPNKFQDCKPYINCAIRLISPGHYWCKWDMEVPSFCFFTCDATENYTDYPRTKHICDGHWDPRQPHCIMKVPDSEVKDLLTPPGYRTVNPS